MVRLVVDWMKYMQAAASCILPKEVNGVLYGGREGRWHRTVCFQGPAQLADDVQLCHTENSLLLDLDSKFDTLRLIQVHAL